ncbi:MAG TPA: transglutaminase domain-containing protein [Blastocatellia bacterium]|nr:transglutaminase domain-containing protein [Blastocatellia bacterium]
MTAYSDVRKATHLNLQPTPIMDHNTASIRRIVATLRSRTASPISFLRSAHLDLSGRIKPVYTLDEFQPASATLAKARGSCSQRMACLEALSRANNIATRVHGLWIDGRFWYPRFYVSRPFIPRRILLAWPQFFASDRWIDFDELHGSTEELAMKSSDGFSNAGETLFEAVAHTAVDFYGKSSQCGVVCSTTQFDLSKYVVGDEGLFDTRDELFAKFGSLQNTIRGSIFEFAFGGRKSV